MQPIIPFLDRLLEEKSEAVEAWFADQYAQTTPFFYNSVDLRHSGHKLVPVDTNLFPAGFNNLSSSAREKAIEGIKSFIVDRSVKKLLIIPENHTQNMGYLENLVTLCCLCEQAGAKVHIGSLAALPEQPIELDTLSGKHLVQVPLKREGDYLETEDGFRPDMILVNNDMTGGSPELLRGVKQCVEPPTELGWYRRKKSVHFEAYWQLARRFAETFDFDPWLIAARFHKCGLINFHERKGMECVAKGVEKVLHSVRVKYEEYGIEENPYVFIKADAGTYGMGIMTAKSGEEAMELNKKMRNKMNKIKEGAVNTEVIIQEGVPTVDMVTEGAAEPMMYLINGEVVGGAYRVNQEKDAYSNLNSTGMSFMSLCDQGENETTVKVESCNIRVYSLVAKLAALATKHEHYDMWEI